MPTLPNDVLGLILIDLSARGKVPDVLLDVPSCTQVITHYKQDSDIRPTVRFRRRVHMHRSISCSSELHATSV